MAGKEIPIKLNGPEMIEIASAFYYCRGMQGDGYRQNRILFKLAAESKQVKRMMDADLQKARRING